MVIVRAETAFSIAAPYQRLSRPPDVAHRDSASPRFYPERRQPHASCRSLFDNDVAPPNPPGRQSRTPLQPRAATLPMTRHFICPMEYRVPSTSQLTSLIRF